MSVLTEKGTLPFGVEHDGKLHKDFELREQLVMDAVEVFEDPALSKRAGTSDAYFSVCVMAKRIVKLGDIPKESITAELLLGMVQQDYNALTAADGRLAAKRAAFQGQAGNGAEDVSGAEKDGVQRS